MIYVMHLSKQITYCHDRSGDTWPHYYPYYSNFSDEEIESHSETDSEVEKETAQEKRLRIAKEYLSQVEAESMFDPKTTVSFYKIQNVD